MIPVLSPLHLSKYDLTCYTFTIEKQRNSCHITLHKSSQRILILVLTLKLSTSILPPPRNPWAFFGIFFLSKKAHEAACYWPSGSCRILARKYHGVVPKGY